MDIVTLGAALNGSAEYVNSHFKGGSNIQIVDNPDGTQTINASGEVSSEDTVARAEIAEMKDGTTIDSFGDVETALATKADTSSTYTKTEVDTALDDKVDKVSGKGLSTNDFTTAEKTKLDDLAEIKSIGTGLNLDSTTGELTATGGGGGGFTPTTAQLAAMNSGITAEKLQADETALAGKVDKETGKGLSTNDYTTAEKTKLAGIAEGAEVNVQSDWNQTTDTADDYIKNKPTLGTAAALDVAVSGNASTSQVVKGDDTRLTDSRNAADVSSWAKAANKPSYVGSEITLTGYVEAQSKASVAATDTANAAIGKLEYRVETNENNISSLDYGIRDIRCLGSFSIGGLYPDGSLKPEQTSRVSSTDTIVFPDHDTILFVSPNYTFGYIPFVNGSAGTWSGFLAGAVKIPANTQLRFQISLRTDITDGSYHAANVDTYCKAIKLVNNSILQNYEYGNGNIGSDGYDIVEQGNATRLLTSYINVKDVDTLALSIGNTYMYGWHTYDDEYVSIENASAFTSNDTLLDVTNVSYVRFNFRKKTDGTFSPSEFANMGFVVFDVSKFSNYANRYSYNGIINIRNTYRVKNYTTASPTSITSSQQGMAIYNGKAFLLYDGGKLAIYDLFNKRIDAEITLASASSNNHVNSANFSTEFASGGIYPLLYISECYGQHRCFVENITNSGSTLVQTISFTNSNGDYTNSTYNNAFDWILDNDTGLLMTYGVMSDGKHKIKMFAKPNTSNATVELTEADVIDDWIVEDYISPSLSSNYVYQGNCAKGGIIYLLTYQSNEIICIDENTHEMTARVPLTFNTSGEPEDLAIYANTMFVVYGDKKIYGMSFD